MHCDDAGKADNRPSRLVAVAAVNRVAIHPLDHGLIKRRPKHPHRQSIVESYFGSGQADQHLLALRVLDPVKWFAVSLAAMRVGGLDAGAIKLRRRQRQLVALARSALPPRTLHIEALTLAPGAGKGAIDVDIDAEIGALRADLIGGHHVIDQALDKGSLIETEKGVSGGLWRNGGCRGRSWFSLSGFRR